MKLPQLPVRIRAIAAHHQVGDDLNILLLQNQYIRAVQTNRILNLDKDTGSLVLVQQIVPCSEFHHRRCDVHFSAHKRIQRSGRGSHTDIGDFPNGILLYIRKQFIGFFHTLNRAFRILVATFTASNCPGLIVLGQINAGK